MNWYTLSIKNSNFKNHKIVEIIHQKIHFHLKICTKQRKQSLIFQLFEQAFVSSKISMHDYLHLQKKPEIQKAPGEVSKSELH